MEKIILSVPFEHKDECKKLGGRWDPSLKRWWIYSSNINKELCLKKWKFRPDITYLVGEDRTFGGNTLFVDLIPRSCWFTNVRYCVDSHDWDRVRSYIYGRVDNTCECCGTKSDSCRLEAHERWEYNIETTTQKLRRIIALCQKCHQATHMGLAEIMGRSDEARLHLQETCKLTDEELKTHITNAFSIWRERNKIEWNLDLSLITENGIELKLPVKKEERHSISTSITIQKRSQQ